MFYTYTYHIAYSVLEGHICSLSKAGKMHFCFTWFSLSWARYEWNGMGMGERRSIFGKAL